MKSAYSQSTTRVSSEPQKTRSKSLSSSHIATFAREAIHATHVSCVPYDCASGSQRSSSVHAQASNRPSPHESPTRYYFRSQGHQRCHRDARRSHRYDPISENRPAAESYIAEIRKITQAPIRYVIYSHQDPEHVAGANRSRMRRDLVGIVSPNNCTDDVPTHAGR